MRRILSASRCSRSCSLNSADCCFLSSFSRTPSAARAWCSTTRLASLAERSRYERICGTVKPSDSASSASADGGSRSVSGRLAT